MPPKKSTPATQDVYTWKFGVAPIQTGPYLKSPMNNDEGTDDVVLQCDSAKLWSLYNEKVTCGAFGCIFKIRLGPGDFGKEAASDPSSAAALFASKFGPDVDPYNVVLKMIVKDEHSTVTPSDRDAKLQTMTASIENNLFEAVDTELEAMTVMGVTGIGPKLYTYATRVECSDVREGSAKSTGKTQLLIIRGVSAYLMERLDYDLVTLLEDDFDQFTDKKKLKTSSLAKVSRQLFQSDSPPDLLRTTLLLMSDVQKRLAEMHEYGYLHGDQRYHLGNAMVTPQGEVRLVDFGISAYYEELAHLNELHAGDHYEHQMTSAQTALMGKLRMALEQAGVELSRQPVGFLKTATRLQFNCNKMRNGGRTQYTKAVMRPHNNYIGLLKKYLTPIAALLDKKKTTNRVNEQALLEAFAELIDAISFMTMKPADFIAPGMFSYMPQVEAQWEHLAFAVLVLMPSEGEKGDTIRFLGDFLVLALLATGKPMSSNAKDLLRNDPQTFKQLLEALFGGRHMTLDYATMLQHAEFVHERVFPLLT